MTSSQKNKKKTNSSAENKIVPDTKHLSAMIEFSAAAGHEINNPLAVILGRTQLLLNNEKDDVNRQSLETIAGQALRIRDMISDVMLFADPPIPDRETFSLSEIIPPLVEKVSQQLQKQTGHSLPQITLDFPESQSIFADRDQFQNVITELLRNAMHASTEATEVKLLIKQSSCTSHCSKKQSDAFLEIAVSDNGCGLAEQEADHLFDPFYSARQAGRGLGFGLCKVWRFVTLHQGTITVEQNATDNGITMKILWPTAIEENK